MPENPQDFTYPNPPNDIPKDGMSAPLAAMMKKGPFGLPWTKKPLPKAGKSGGKPAGRTTRSGVHKLGTKHRKNSY